MKKKILLPILLSTLLFLCGFIYIHFVKRTKGFSVKKILSHHTYSPRWDFGNPTPEQTKLLDQISSEPFTLLGSGKECYAFVNESGTIVVKFFKQKHMCTQSILNYIPLAQHLKMLHQETITRRTHHRNRIFSSYQIAYEHLPFQTGILYLHLNKTTNLKRPILIIEPSGKKHTLELDNMEFLVQRRALPIFDIINILIQQNKVEIAKAAITSILNLITVRQNLGIGDDDINCERNLGLIDHQAVQIDIGEFFLTLPSSPTQSDFTNATNGLRLFLESHYPSLATYLKSEIDQKSKDSKHIATIHE